ncbi:MAG: hypothetical protein IKT94_05670 [Rikenellaceae bacterium]|nr:hypothetical protein [Rikenellaceae bacterium]
MIKAINAILLVIIALLTICVLIIICEAFLTDGVRIQYNSDGVKNMVAFWKDYSAIIITLGSCLTLFIASYNLGQYLNVETINALATLRNMLNSPENRRVHEYLLPDDERKAILSDSEGETNFKEICNIDIFNYIGTLELGCLMLENRVIDEDKFNNQFGYRVNNLSNSQEIKEHILKNKEYYLGTLIDRLK